MKMETKSKSLAGRISGKTNFLTTNYSSKVYPTDVTNYVN